MVLNQHNTINVCILCMWLYHAWCMCMHCYCHLVSHAVHTCIYPLTCSTTMHFLNQLLLNYCNCDQHAQLQICSIVQLWHMQENWRKQYWRKSLGINTTPFTNQETVTSQNATVEQKWASSEWSPVWTKDMAKDMQESCPHSDSLKACSLQV